MLGQIAPWVLFFFLLYQARGGFYNVWYRYVDPGVGTNWWDEDVPK